MQTQLERMQVEYDNLEYWVEELHAETNKIDERVAELMTNIYNLKLDKEMILRKISKYNDEMNELLKKIREWSD